MSSVGGKGKGGRGGKGKAGVKNESQSKKAGLTFPVGRLSRYLREGRYSARVGAGAPVYLAAVLEYLSAEILELAGRYCNRKKRKRIIPRHIQMAVKSDEELDQLFEGVTISEGGVPEKIHQALKPVKKGAKEGATKKKKTKSKAKSKSKKSKKSKAKKVKVQEEE
mgnify:CR=1 FL=1